MDANGSLTPDEALDHIDETTTAVRRAGRWRLAGWWILTAFFTVNLLGDRLFPRFMRDWSLVFLGATVLLLGSLVFVARVFERRSRVIEGWLFTGLIGVVLLATALYEWVLPEGVTGWTFAVAALPLVLCAIATVRILRR